MSRDIYKLNKSFGKKTLLNWSSTGPRTNFILSTEFHLSLNHTLKSIHKVQTSCQDPPTIMMAIKILQKLYPFLKKDEQEQCLNLFSQLLGTLACVFNDLSDPIKEFFFTQVHILHKVVFFSKKQMHISEKYANQYSLDSLLISPDRFSSQTDSKFTPSVLLFQQLLSMSMLASNAKM